MYKSGLKKIEDGHSTVKFKIKDKIPKTILKFYVVILVIFFFLSLL